MSLAWGGYVNGQVPAGALVDTGSGRLAQADTARNWKRMAADCKAATGAVLGITEAYRPYAEQVRIFKARYTAGWASGVWWNGSYWRKKAGVAVAAVPGTSNHGWGRAFDIWGYGGTSGPAWRWLLDHAAAYGFSWTTGRNSGEMWHWEYVGGINTAASNVVDITEPSKRKKRQVTIGFIKHATNTDGTVYAVDFGALGSPLRPLLKAEYQAGVAAGIELAVIEPGDFDTILQQRGVLMLAAVKQKYLLRFTDAPTPAPGFALIDYNGWAVQRPKG